MSSTGWWRAQLAMGALVALAATVHWLLPIDTSDGGGFGVLPSALIFRVVFPVLAASLLINGMLMAVRSSRSLGAGERVLLIAQFAGIVVATVFAFLPRGEPLRELSSLSVLLGLAVLLVGFVIAVVEIVNWREPRARSVRRL